MPWGLLLKWGGPLVVVALVFGTGFNYGSVRAAKKHADKLAKLETKVEELSEEYQTKLDAMVVTRDEAVRKANGWSTRVEDQSAAFRELEEMKAAAEERLRVRLALQNQQLDALKEEASVWRDLAHGPQVFESMEDLTVAASSRLEALRQHPPN
ncbi:MAG: hypothetical protein DRH30_14280 [Deltaproteobacteria bacterium]|nr:MAG: hypothetical protein DRH30_14280 [Deltaproteobacteria bacterium]